MKVLKITGDYDKVYELIRVDKAVAFFADVDEDEECIELSCRFEGAHDSACDYYTIGTFYWGTKRPYEKTRDLVDHILNKIHMFMCSDTNNMHILVDEAQY